MVTLQKACVFSFAEPCGTGGAGAYQATDSLHIYVRTPHRQAYVWGMKGGILENGLKWVAVAPFGLKMGGNEAHEVQDHF